MQEVRNTDGRLVAKIDEETRTVVISIKSCTTRLRMKNDGSIEIENEVRKVKPNN